MTTVKSEVYKWYLNDYRVSLRSTSGSWVTIVKVGSTSGIWMIICKGVGLPVVS